LFGFICSPIVAIENQVSCTLYPDHGVSAEIKPRLGRAPDANQAWIERPFDAPLHRCFDMGQCDEKHHPMASLLLLLFLACLPTIVRAGNFAITAAIWAIVVPLALGMMTMIAARLAVVALREVAPGGRSHAAR
jgi:hypothetical protein